MLQKIFRKFHYSFLAFFLAHTLWPSAALAMYEGNQDASHLTLHQHFLPSPSIVDVDSLNPSSPSPHLTGVAGFMDRWIVNPIEKRGDAIINVMVKGSAYVMGAVLLFTAYVLFIDYITPHPSNTSGSLPIGFYAAAPDNEEAGTILSPVFDAMINNISAWFHLYKKSGYMEQVGFGTEGFAKALSISSNRETLMGFINGTCPNLTPVQQSFKGLALPGTGFAQVCAYALNVSQMGTAALSLFGCGLLKVPTDFQINVVSGCMNYTFGWMKAHANVVAIRGSKGVLTVSSGGSDPQSLLPLVETHTYRVRDTFSPSVASLSLSLSSSPTRLILETESDDLTSSYTTPLSLSDTRPFTLSRLMPLSHSHSLTNEMTASLTKTKMVVHTTLPPMCSCSCNPGYSLQQQCTYLPFKGSPCCYTPSNPTIPWRNCC